MGNELTSYYDEMEATSRWENEGGSSGGRYARDAMSKMRLRAAGRILAFRTDLMPRWLRPFELKDRTRE